MIQDFIIFGWTSLTGHRLRTGLCVLGVSMGIVAVIMLTALGEGARRYVMNEFTSIGTNLLAILPGKTETTGAMPGIGGVPHDLTLQDFLALKKEIYWAKYVVPVSMGTETVSHGERRRQVAVVGTTTDFLDVRELRVEQGQFLPRGEVERGSAVVVLGKVVAKELFPAENPIGQVVRVGGWRMRVIGVLEEIGTQLGIKMDEVAIVPVATGMRMLNRTSLFRILFKVRSERDLGMTCREVIRILIERHDEEDITCVTQDAVVTTFSSILETFTLVVAALASISLSVAGIGIMNVMLVTVSERTEEIGLLRALGATRRHILLVFLMESMMLAGLGGVIGVAGGMGLVELLVMVYPAVPASVPEWILVASLAVSLLLGSVFGVTPARRAARMDPIEALARPIR